MKQKLFFAPPIFAIALLGAGCMPARVQTVPPVPPPPALNAKAPPVPTPPAPKVTAPPSVKKESSSFIESLGAKVPKDFVRKEGRYPEIVTGAIEPVKTSRFMPCASPEDPTCVVRLDLWSEDGKTLQDYQAANGPFDRYKSVFGGTDTEGTLRSGGTYVFTGFMGSNTAGAESDLQREYVFSFADGSTARALVDYWPYADIHGGKAFVKVPAAIQKTIDLYHGLLMTDAVKAL